MHSLVGPDLQHCQGMVADDGCGLHELWVEASRLSKSFP